MKKKFDKHLVKISILSFALVFVMLFSISNSSARFSSMISGDSAHSGAKWWVKVNSYETSSSQSFVVDLASSATPNPNIKPGSLAPSSTGKFEFLIDCTGCETSVDWVVSFSLKDPSLTYPQIVFFTGEENKPSYSEIDMTSTVLEGQISYNPDNMSTQALTLSINWKWPVNHSLDETEFSGKNFEYIVTIVASQHQA